MKVWIARDNAESGGQVYMFAIKPVKDGTVWLPRQKRYFDDDWMFPLGRRPKLPFKLKPGECRKVEIKFV